MTNSARKYVIAGALFTLCCDRGAERSAIDAGVIDGAVETGASQGDASRSDGGYTGGGAGTGLYRRNSLARLAGWGMAGELVLASTEVGFSTVEVLRIQADGQVDARPLEPPVNPAAQRCRIPISLGASDLDGDGRDDVLVMDTCSGNWVALGNDGTSVAAQAILGSIPALEWFELFDEGPERRLLVGAFGHSVALLSRPRMGGAWKAPLVRSLPDLGVAVPVANPFTAATATAGTKGRILFQGQARLFSIGSDDLLAPQGGVDSFATLVPQGVEAPYLAPFAAFDHLTAVSLEACPLLALGVGVFPRDAGHLPRRLQRLTFGDKAFSVHELDMPMDVSSFATLVDGDRKSALLGVVGAAGGSDVFAVYRLTDCGRVELLARTTTDFGWRAADAPGFGEGGPTVPKTNGVMILAVSDEAARVHRFIHYDGYDFRQWTFKEGEINGTPGTIEARKTAVHAIRSDLVFR